METEHLYSEAIDWKGVDWNDPKQIGSIENKQNVKICYRAGKREWTFHSNAFRSVMRAIDKGDITLTEVSEVFGVKVSTFSRWHNGERKPSLYYPEDLEINSGRLYILGEMIGKRFRFDKGGYEWVSERSGIFNGYIYPQLVQLCGFLPKEGKGSKTILKSKPVVTFYTEINGIKSAFLKRLEHLGFVEKLENGSYRITVQRQNTGPPYFQGLFDRHGVVNTHKNTPSFSVSCGKKWGMLLRFFEREKLPVVITKIDLSSRDRKLDQEERQEIEKHFPVSEYQPQSNSCWNGNVHFWIAPVYLNKWLQKQKELRMEPNPETIADSVIYMGRCALYSFNPKKANRIADCLEIMASEDYGKSLHAADKKFQGGLSYLLRQKDSKLLVAEIRDRFPRNEEGYSLYIYPLEVEKAGVTRQESDEFIRELSEGFRLAVPDEYPGREYLNSVLRSGAVPYNIGEISHFSSA